MTYCLAMKLASGLIFLSDSRTNAGVDHIATFRKMYRFENPEHSALVLLSAGNLATTQQVIQRLRRQQESDGGWQLPDLHAYAAYIGRCLREEIASHGESEAADFRAHFIVGGQLANQEMELFHIYPEGNFIAATEETPYFQIGESKYGKPIIDRIVHYQTDLDTATRCALISMDSTIRSNLSVGLPLDLLRYEKDSLHTQQHSNITEQHAEFQQLRNAWSHAIKDAFFQLPTSSELS